MKLDYLNENQIKAIKHKDGPMLVLAGAGSGKTSVLTKRVAYLIESGVNPYNILAITFTNKAALEMKERILSILGNTARQIQISTFHSLGLKIIKENIEYLIYDKNFVILDSDDTLTLLKKIIKNMNLDTKIYIPRVVRSKISNVKNELMSIDEFKKIEFDDNIIKIYKEYINTLVNNNSVDFDDLLILPIKLFKENPNILMKYQERFKYLLIDEYQDTNEAQYILTKMLSAKYKNIFVVGDADQSIYAFRGANFKNILNFEKDFKDAITVKLEQNYRSTKNILDAANSVIKHNKQRKDKNLITDNDKGKKVKYIKTNNEIDEAIYVVKKIKDIVKENSDYDKIAILYRTNAQSRIIEEEMLKGSIPYRIVGSFYFYNRKEIKDLLCYLRLLINEKDDISFLRVINTPKRGIGTKTISNLETRAKELGVCLYDATINGKELGFKQLLEDMRSKIETMSLTEIVDMVLNNSGMKEDLKKQKTIEAEIRLENLEEFKSITKSYEENLGVVSLKDFLEELTLVSDMAEHNDAPNQVTLMTIHAVKGLEFDYVFVVGLEEGIFPHFNAIMDNSSSAIEEERRLCYVAITRAKKELYLLNAKRRMLFGKEQINPTSRFINEIDNDYLEKEKSSEKIRITDFIKKNMFNNHDTDYQIGDKVKHTEFGNGIITSVDKSIITIAFSYPYGIKKMMKNHKSISKI